MKMNKWELTAIVIMAFPKLLIKKGIITPEELRATILEIAEISDEELDEALEDMKSKTK